MSIGRMSLLKSILENLEEEEGRTASIGKALRRFVASSSRRLVVSLSSRRLAFVSSSCFRFAGRGGGGGKKRGRWDELNQRGSKRPLEDALKSNEDVKL